MECIPVLWTNGKWKVVGSFFFPVLFSVVFLAVLGLCACAWLSLVAASKVYCSRSARASQGCGFLCCGAQVPGTWASAHGLWSVGSAVAAHRLSCPAPHRIFLDQELNPCPLHWQVDSLPLDHQGKIQLVGFLPLFYLKKKSLPANNLDMGEDELYP